MTRLKKFIKKKNVSPGQIFVDDIAVTKYSVVNRICLNVLVLFKTSVPTTLSSRNYTENIQKHIQIETNETFLLFIFLRAGTF